MLPVASWAATWYLPPLAATWQVPDSTFFLLAFRLVFLPSSILPCPRPKQLLYSQHTEGDPTSLCLLSREYVAKMNLLNAHVLGIVLHALTIV